MRSSTRHAALIVALVSTGAARAAETTVVLRVPGEYPTIQSAIDAAPTTGAVEVRVAAGTYRESVVATGFADLSVVGAPGARIESRGYEPAVRMCMSLRMQLAGFTIDSDAIGVDFYGVASATVSGIDVARSGTYGIAAEGATTQTPLVNPGSGDYHPSISVSRTALRIENTAVTGTRGDAVRVGAFANLAVASSRIFGPTGDGISADSVTANLQVSSSTIDGAGDNGVDVTNARIDIDGCVIAGSRHAGVLVTDGVGSVTSCDVTWSGGHGIEVRGRSGVRVADCTVTNSEGDGIRTTGGSVETNTVAGTVGAGIVALVSGHPYALMVVGNHVSRAGTTGISVSSTAARVTHNVVESCGADGISVGGNDVFVTVNVVNAAGGRGIDVVGMQPTVTSNVVERPAGDGITVLGGYADVESNLVTSAGGDGLRVTSEHGAVRLNRVDDAAGNGLVLGYGWDLVEGQQVSGSGGDGICVTGMPGRAGAPVTRNKVTGSHGDGIDLGATSRARVSKNVVSDCGECGIRLDNGAARNRIARNTARGSGSFDLYESAGAGRNQVDRSNKFTTRHRRGQP